MRAGTNKLSFESKRTALRGKLVRVRWQAWIPDGITESSLEGSAVSRRSGLWLTEIICRYSLTFPANFEPSLRVQFWPQDLKARGAGVAREFETTPSGSQRCFVDSVERARYASVTPETGFHTLKRLGDGVRKRTYTSLLTEYSRLEPFSRSQGFF